MMGEGLCPLQDLSYNVTQSTVDLAEAYFPACCHIEEVQRDLGIRRIDFYS